MERPPTPPVSDPENPLRARVAAFLLLPRLPLWLGALGVLLSSPTLFIGLHLDDYIHKYLLLHLPGSAEIARSYVSPYAIANGDPVQNHWLVEQGLAPWWTYDRLLLSFFRPVSALTHHVDYALFPESPVLMHAHSLLWYFAVVYAATRLYRGILGTTVAAGFAAFLYAVDHTHGLPVGWLANRNALPAIFFGLCALRAYHAGRTGSRGAALVAPALFLLGLLAGEVTLAVFAYIVAHALTLDDAKLGSRVAAVAPYAVLVVAWRAVYNALGYGARGSGLYLDPVHEPLAFAAALVHRIPLLVLGEIGMPPAEAYYFVAEGLRPLAYGAALVGTVATLVVVWPLVKADKMARFWALGSLLSLPLACTAYPHSRLLFFVGLGAMALLAILVRDAWGRAAWMPLRPAWHLVAQPYLAAAVGIHAVLSPFLLPLQGCSVVTTAGIANKAVPAAMRAVTAPDDELFVMNAPEYFSVNLLPFLSRLEKKPEPKHLRMLSIGPVSLTVTRTAPNVLDVQFQGGLLRDPLSQLYRSARLPMKVGETVKLEGFTVAVTAVTEDGRPERATFTFADALEAPRYKFLRWDRDTYARFVPPAIGQSATLAEAHMPFEVGGKSE